MFPRLCIRIALEKEGNISLEEINIPRPEVIITFNLLGNHGIFIVHVIYRVYQSVNLKYGIYKPREVEHPIKKQVRLRTSFFFGCSTSRGPI